MSVEIPAIIEYVRFRNPEGFGILSANLNAHSSKYNAELENVISKNIPPSKSKFNRFSKYDNFTITVNMLKPEENLEGQQCIFIGDFFTHPKYGPQFKSEFYYLDEPVTEAGLQMYLMTLPNIKEVRSKQIIKKFGVKETIRILDEDPYKLVVIRGITEPRIEPIKKEWDKGKTLRELYVWLSEHGITPKIGQKVYDLWGIESKAVLSENPYKLTEIQGIGFVQADKLAHKILDSVPWDYRMVACIQYVLNSSLYKDSNLCMLYSLLKNKVLELLGKCDQENNLQQGSVKRYTSMISKVIKDNLEIFTAVKENTDAGKTYIYLRSIWDKEKSIAKFIYDRHDHERKKAECTDKDIEDAEEDLSKLTGQNITLDDTQKEAVKSAFNHKISNITGSGGSGKSTICRCIYFLAKKKRLSVRLMSPTGKAAQVLSDKTKGNAATIHRSLKMVPGDEYAKEDIGEDIVIIDEFSMVGIDTLFALLDAMSNNLWGNIILVGDSNQLPSVSPGNFLSDITNSGCANVVELDKIHRQDENSYITIIANEIAKGNHTEIPENASDIKWFDINPDTFSDDIQKFVTYFMKKKDILDLQIISPMYKGQCGVNEINNAIQKLMATNNGTMEQFIRREFKYFHVGDRIIQTQNNYNKQIFNGDMGVIDELGCKVIDPAKSDVKEHYVIVKFYNDLITFVGDEINQLQLAWAITVHKFQGSSSPYISFVMAAEQKIMMSKELVYTSFTRAEKYLIIYGDRRMLQIVPDKSIIKKRYTNLCNMTTELRENRQVLRVLGE